MNIDKCMNQLSLDKNIKLRPSDHAGWLVG